jgi:acylphosphatase
MNTRARVFISGKVQGVYFRVWTRAQARDLGLTGRVKNLSDGRVEAVIEGSKSKVDKMIEKCKSGPKVAHVENVEVKKEKATGEFQSFEIER